MRSSTSFRKHIALLSAAVILSALLLVGCGGKDTASATSSQVKEESSVMESSVTQEESSEKEESESSKTGRVTSTGKVTAGKEAGKAESSAVKEESESSVTKAESSAGKEESSKAQGSKETSKPAGTETRASTNTNIGSGTSGNAGSSSPNASGGTTVSNSSASGSTKNNTGSGTNTSGSGSPNTTTKPATPAQSSQPTHTHNWVPQYATKTVYHDAVTHEETVQTGTKTVVDQEAWDEQVITGYRYWTLFSDGYKFYDDEIAPTTDPNVENTVLMDYIEDYMFKHNCTWSGGADPIYTTVHHDAVTHEEPVYETKTVVDQPAYDEQVEELTGYKCSECGATKN